MPNIELGSNLYLFLAAIGEYRDALVISAHGGYDGGSGTFDPPAGSSLHFYVPHGSVQSDFGIGRFKNGVPVFETLEKGQNCHNYALSKYQGRHGGTAGKPAETYESIEGNIAAIEDEIARQKKYQGRPGYRNDKVIHTFDVLTIRNRAFSGDVSLHKALKAALATHQYKDVHCFFCRSPM
jgi:hypothetical protein